MKITLRVKTRTSRNDLVRNPDGTYTAFLTAAPVDGEANTSLVKLISKRFGVARSVVRITRGLRSKTKIISIGED